MIKLNNKNITYVALADSNNSVKGVKEIWYADSNNSVKLVYRRKDALIEGEDYEKYHWLKGDDSAYIQGIAFDLWNNHFNARIGKSERLRYFSYYVQSTAANFKIDVDNNVSIPYFLVIFRNAENGVHIDELRPYSAMPDVVDYDFYIDNSTFYCNRDGVIHTNSGTNIAIESNWTSIQPMIKSAKISYIREVLPNNSYRSNLIPCKLLKPVPKWLDANGIRRQIGECGMIDLVSGEFYGNVNSVGTFTVENYYERKEWLIAKIYETTGVNPMCDLPINSDTFEFRVIMQSENSINIGHIKNPNYWYYSDNLTNIKVWNTVGRTTDFTSNIGSNDMTFKSTSSEFTINSIQVTKYGFPAKYKTFFNNRPNGNAIVYNSPITVNNEERYIPCTLTMDLPASMDANGISRTKGTSGMWDLVSDRFYGNVANSGTFKAVNLAEGVDYEVYQWLVGDGTAKINVSMNLWNNGMDICLGKIDIASVASVTYMSKSINSTESGRLTIGIPQNENDGVHYLMVIFRDNDDAAIHIADINPYSSMSNEVSMQFFITNGIAYCNQDGTLKTGLSMTETKWNKDNSFNAPFLRAKYLREYSKSDNSYLQNLIPVKLLRSIPAKYDANGIARQVGECGMYDTINDVFYGNVASSGMFSVEDDN